MLKSELGVLLSSVYRGGNWVLEKLVTRVRYQYFKKKILHLCCLQYATGILDYAK